MEEGTIGCAEQEIDTHAIEGRGEYGIEGRGEYANKKVG
jgi:hypothetical protein